MTCDDHAALVAAVERVQALHEPLKLFMLDDNGSIDYSKPFDTLCRGCTDPDIVNAWECDDGDPGDDYVQHPCPTIQALGDTMNVKTFRKKPVEIQAAQWDGTASGATPIIDWILGQGGSATYHCAHDIGGRCPGTASMHTIGIRTLEGTMQARQGDWIIRGVAGEFYPIKEAIFRETYEPVEES